MGWNADKPAIGNQIAEDIPDIEENLEYLYNLVTVQEIMKLAGQMTVYTTAGCAAAANNEYATNDINITYLAFDGASEEYCGWNQVMPPNWNRGTVKAKFYWSSAAGSTAGDTVEWEIAGVAISDNDALDVAEGTSQVISDTLLANDGAKLQITAATPALTIAGTPALGDWIHFRISRNVGGTDNMSEDAWLFAVVLQFTVNTAVSAW